MSTTVMNAGRTFESPSIINTFGQSQTLGNLPGSEVDSVATDLIPIAYDEGGT